MCTTHYTCYTKIMPRVDLWIRKTDYADWLAIEDKPESLHQWIEFETVKAEVIKNGSVELNGVVITHASKQPQSPTVKVNAAAKPLIIKTPEDVIPTLKKLSANQPPVTVKMTNNWGA